MKDYEKYIDELKEKHKKEFPNTPSSCMWAYIVGCLKAQCNYLQNKVEILEER